MLKRVLAAAAVLGAGIFSFAIVPVYPANAAAPDPRIFIESECHPNIWYVNPDEGGADPQQGDRRPTATPDGFTFEGNQLMHTGIAMTLPQLKLSGPGSYTADPEPSLTSFFSVEVGNPGYATLRWDTVEHKWNIGGTDIWSDDPTTFVGNKGLTDESTVFSFGVGYVNTPNDGTLTTVSEVGFNGQDYNLMCRPAPTTAPVTTAPVITPAATTVATLPVTGTSTRNLLIMGAALIVGGGLLLLIRKQRS